MAPSPRRGRPPRATWALAGLAAACLWSSARSGWAFLAAAGGAAPAQPPEIGRRKALLAGAAAGAVDLGSRRKAWAEMVATPSGLRYEILKEGKGDPVVEDEQVQVYYDVWLRGFEPRGSTSQVNLGMMNAIKGPFLIQTSRRAVDAGDQIVQAQTPMQFLSGSGRSNVLGIGEGVVGMRKGEIRRLTIPPSLAYGDKANPLVPANSTLYVELILRAKGMPPPGPNERYYGEGKKTRKKRRKKKAPPPEEEGKNESSASAAA